MINFLFNRIKKKSDDRAKVTKTDPLSTGHSSISSKRIGLLLLLLTLVGVLFLLFYYFSSAAL